MTDVVLNLPVEALPELIRRAVDSVPRTVLMDVASDEALVGRRTNFAAMSETTRFSFHRVGAGTSEVRAEATSGGVVGFVVQPRVATDTGRAVLDAMVRLARAGA